MKEYDVPYYLKFIPKKLLEELDKRSTPVLSVNGLKVSSGLREQFPNIETDSALEFVVDIYINIRTELQEILHKRGIDRVFIDEETKNCTIKNENIPYLDPAYETVIGKTDRNNRLVVGPYNKNDSTEKQVDVPSFMKGFQVTLFGPPDTQRMSINAMNAIHRKLPDEPEMVAKLLDSSLDVPRWGADDEDSKTPIMKNFLQACENLTSCFDKSISFEDPKTNRKYSLEKEKLSLPIKRIPGLALPDGNHLFNSSPLPLHLVDFALHIYHNWNRKEALVFYVPKLENEEEARYFKHLITEAEIAISKRFPEYEKNSIKILVVFENPRAIFRINEIASELYPHFIGGSLGWHDFLASTARIFRYDPNYRIPVKADPNIVINHIKESHQILVKNLEKIGAIKIGGMYGILYEDGNSESFQVSIIGFIKDVVTQMKRGLDGFWVAHPNFVRIGMAIVQAWKRQHTIQNDKSLDELVMALVKSPLEQSLLMSFIHGDDVCGLSENSPLYNRGVLAADIETSDVISNNDPIEIRYNVFQALQYLADWLSGNGCVALPAIIKDSTGKPVFVRVMDDLATTERSRWELWAEINHKRFSIEEFDSILKEEMAFICKGEENDTKKIQVKYVGEAVKWYPVAEKILRKLVVDENPAEFVTELILPFTFDFIRNSENPIETLSMYSDLSF